MTGKGVGWPVLIKGCALWVATTPAGNSMSRPPKRFCPSPGEVDAGATTIFEPESKTYTMVVRSVGPVDSALTTRLILSEPAPDEECNISLESMREYRLPFLPEEQSIMEDLPLLKKASLPCGHGFNALALLYHFSRNSMTCPCCRAGHTGVVMGERSIPAHVRRQFGIQLARLRLEESREQLIADSLEAARLMEQEVVRLEVLFPVTRVVLILCAYESHDSSEPVLSLELPLTSSQTPDRLEFVSSGYCLRQLAINLRFMPLPVRSFEVAIGLRSLLDAGDVQLFRTVRFEPALGDRLVVASAHAEESPVMTAVEVHTAGGSKDFTRFEWTVERPLFSELLAYAFCGVLGNMPDRVASV